MEKQVQGYTLTLKENDGGTEVIGGEDISLEYLPGKEPGIVPKGKRRGESGCPVR